MSQISTTIVAAASTADGEPVRRVKLLPMGVINARDGRKWVLADRAHADQVVAASLAQAGGTDIMFDYDHQSFFGAKDGVGGTAPASGWIKQLQAEDDGIYAEVEWTAAAEAKLRAREYRYVSPLFHHDRESGRIIRIANAALVNTPAITDLPAVASAQGGDPTPEGTSMKFTEQLAQKLGLPATSTEAQILDAVATQSAAASALASTATALGLAASAKPEEITAAASAAVSTDRVDPTKFAPMAVVTALQNQVKALTDGQAASAASAEVEAAIEAGKLAPALKDWGIAYASADLAGFKTFVEGAPKVVDPAGGNKRGAVPEGSDPVLTEELAAAARVLGLTDEQIIAAAKEETH